MKGLKSQIVQLFENNRRWVGEKSYTVPSPDTYPYQWFWDSCFHAITLLNLGQYDRALDELDLLVTNKTDTDFIPHMLFHEEQPEPTEPHFYNWGTRGGSSIIQPPLLAQVLLRILRLVGNNKRIEKIFKAYQTHLKYLVDSRLDPKLDLFIIINPDESGLDNLPSYDKVLGLEPVHSISAHLARRFQLVDSWRQAGFNISSMKDKFYVADVLFNTVAIGEFKAAKILAQEFNIKNGYSDVISGLENGYQNNLMTENGAYNLSMVDGTWDQDRVITWTALLPTWLQILESNQAKSILTNLLRFEHLLGNYGVRTVSAIDRSYDPEPTKFIGGFWRGPVWHVSNWFIYHGLMNYGYREIATSLKEASLDAIGSAGFRECYSPESGIGYGAKNFTWAGLIIDMK